MIAKDHLKETLPLSMRMQLHLAGMPTPRSTDGLRATQPVATEKLVQILTQNFSPNVEVVDIGCGDGTFTLEIAERFQPAAICGIDPAADAIAVARSRIPRHLRGSVSFEVGDIYNLQAMARAGAIAVVRGVLHHLDRPRAAIAELARHFSFVIALEPNGYNPAMKIIERASKYHREHDEKSYWPPTLNRWFREEGFVPASQEFFCLVPYFCPTPVAKLLSLAERIVEAVPTMREICCGTNLAYYHLRDLRD